jgi:hypothetical protein
MTWLDAAQAVLWAAVGFAGGYYVCRANLLVSDTADGKEAQMAQWRVNPGGALLVVWALVVSGGLTWAAIDRQHVTECQARFNAAVVAAQVTRSRIADEDRALSVAHAKTTVTLVRTVSTARTPQETRAALRAYIAANDDLDRRAADLAERRRRNPLPDPAVLARCG